MPATKRASSARKSKSQSQAASATPARTRSSKKEESPAQSPEQIEGVEIAPSSGSQTLYFVLFALVAFEIGFALYAKALPDEAAAFCQKFQLSLVRSVVLVVLVTLLAFLRSSEGRKDSLVSLVVVGGAFGIAAWNLAAELKYTEAPSTVLAPHVACLEKFLCGLCCSTKSKIIAAFQAAGSNSAAPAAAAATPSA